MTQTDHVNLTERYDRRPWRQAAASYGRDVRRMLRDFDEDGIQLYARIAARFARLALQEEVQS